MRTLWWAIALLAWLLGAGAGRAAAQVTSSVTPEYTAAGLDWYAAREPIFVHGAYYEPAGASVFFDGKVMVPIARLDGVPLYADVTLEPFSLIFVPIGRGLVQPYERRRSGDLAGTTGSRPPSFPVELYRDPTSERVLFRTVTPPYIDPAEPGVTVPDEVSTPWAARALADAPDDATYDCCCPPCCYHDRMPVASRRLRDSMPGSPSGPLTTAIRPTATRGIWVMYDGARWQSDGPAVVLDPARMHPIGNYDGVSVYGVTSEPDRIYLPPVEGLAAPYKRMPNGQ